MNILTRRIAALAALNLLVSGFAFAQDIPATEAREAEVGRKEAEIAVRAAQKQAEEARRQVDAAQEQRDAALAEAYVELAKAQAVPAAPETTISTGTRRHWPSRSGSGVGAVLLIPSARINTEDIVKINEDMNVMSRIFEKQLARARMARSSVHDPYSSRVPVLGDLPLVGGMLRGPGGQRAFATEAIYLEGFGAIFFMEVAFPLVPSPKAEEEKAEESTDRVWAQTRQEIFMPGTVQKGKQSPPAEEYDAEKVKKLKSTLINALKHASNIRVLKPDHWAIVTVIDRAAQSDTTGSDIYTYQGKIVTALGGADTGSVLPTVLTICAKKSDIDSFSKGTLDFDEFEKQIRVFMSYVPSEHGSRSHAKGFYYQLLAE
ncbi:MAG: hypothetical protein ACYTDV_01325 [Planctomycetota bacterium]|jgi:hypothetical protein